MTEPRARRIVRRAVMALAVVVLLWGGYISSVAILCFAVNAGALPIDLPETWLWHRYSAPAIWYTRSDLPGADQCRDLLDWACFEGDRMAGY
jgi:hypothetical protein